MGLSVIVRVTLKDGTYHEVGGRGFDGIWCPDANIWPYRTLDMAISRTAKGKPPLSRKPRKKGLQMLLNEHYGILATYWAIASMTRIMLPR